MLQNLVLNTEIGKRQSTHKYAKDIVSELLGTDIQVPGIPNYDMNHLCFQNLVLDTVTGTSCPFSPDYFITTKTHYTYNPEAKCPT
jgi:hypothetical protein